MNFVIGARVMLLKNIDINSKLINGMRGSNTDFIEKSNELVTIFVKFDCQSENEKPVAIIRSIISQGMVLGHKMTVKQFPLCLAWAVTAHKA